MSTESARQVIIVQSPKNPGVAAILGFLFGPLGLLYVGWKPALIMFIIVVPTAVLTVGFGLLLTQPVCAVVGYMCVNAANKKLLESKN
jgi:hypothetical protein